MSMRSSLLLCANFQLKNSSRRCQEVENCSTFQRCRTAEKRFKHDGLLLEVAVGLICHWILAHGGSEERVNIIVKNMREVQFTSI